MRLKMLKNTVFSIITAIVLILISCGNGTKSTKYDVQRTKMVDGDQKTYKSKLPTEDLLLPTIKVGANQTEKYLRLLETKRVGVVGNQSSVIFKDKNRKNDLGDYTHLVDSLLSLNINVKKYSPQNMDLEVPPMLARKSRMVLIQRQGCPSFHFMATIKNQNQNSSKAWIF